MSKHIPFDIQTSVQELQELISQTLAPEVNIMSKKILKNFILQISRKNGLSKLSLVICSNKKIKLHVIHIE